MSASPRKDFSQEWKDQDGGVSSFTLTAAKTQEAWQKLWDAAHGYASDAPRLPAGKMALGIFMGSSNSPSDVTVSKIEERGGQTVVTWSEEKLNSAMCVMFKPYLLKWVDKTETPVVFQEKKSPASCHSCEKGLIFSPLRCDKAQFKIGLCASTSSALSWQVFSCCRM